MVTQAVMALLVANVISDCLRHDFAKIRFHFVVQGRQAPIRLKGNVIENARSCFGIDGRAMICYTL